MNAIQTYREIAVVTYREEVARVIISKFVCRAEANVELERLLLQYGEQVRTSYPSRFREMHVIIHAMGKVREEYHVLSCMIRNLRYELVKNAFMSIEQIMGIIGRKRHRIITEAAQRTINQNPSYFRSHHFNDESLIRMSICRSFMDDDLVRKWKRLHDHIKTVSVRLKLLTITIANVNDLCVEASDYDSDRLEEGVLTKKNARVAARMAEV